MTQTRSWQGDLSAQIPTIITTDPPFAWIEAYGNARELLGRMSNYRQPFLGDEVQVPIKALAGPIRRLAEAEGEEAVLRAATGFWTRVAGCQLPEARKAAQELLEAVEEVLRR